MNVTLNERFSRLSGIESFCIRVSGRVSHTIVWGAHYVHIGICLNL